MATSTVTIKFSSNYVPYGNNYAVSGKEEFMYTGNPYDSATALYYFGARYYDQSIERFVTQDSYTGEHNDPQSLNLYVYARDNPERMVDPNGHMFILSATLIDGIIPRTWLAPPPVSTTTSTTTSTTASCAGSPDACLSRKGNYQYSSPSSSGKSPDVTLTQQRVDQYAITPTIGIGGGPTSASLTITQPNTNDANSFNWNAAASLGILVGSVMVTTAAVVFPNPASPVLLNSFGGADVSTFDYLSGNPSPTVQRTLQAWWTGFYQGFLCNYAGC